MSYAAVDSARVLLEAGVPVPRAALQHECTGSPERRLAMLKRTCNSHFCADLAYRSADCARARCTPRRPRDRVLAVALPRRGALRRLPAGARGIQGRPERARSRRLRRGPDQLPADARARARLRLPLRRADGCCAARVSASRCRRRERTRCCSRSAHAR